MNISRCKVHNFSSDETPTPLFLWVGEKNAPSMTNSSSLLLPAGISPPPQPTVFSPEDVLKQVNAHYESDTHFVGGMGEVDPGVWFASSNAADPLTFGEMIQESISLVKDERHGVPFSLCTSGLVAPTIPLSELGLSTLHVSLYAGSPTEYAKTSGNTERDFGTLCGFIVEAAEQGIAVEAWVLEAHASGARDLAISLGAQQVNVLIGSK